MAQNDLYWLRVKAGRCGTCGKHRERRRSNLCIACRTLRREQGRQYREAQRLAPGPNRVAGGGTWQVVPRLPEEDTP